MRRPLAKSSNAATKADFRPVGGLLPRFCRPKRAISPVFPISGHTLGMKCKQSPLGDQQIGQPLQREQLRGVLGQALVEHLPQAKPVLDDVERMFDLGTDATLMRSICSSKRPVSFAGSALHLPGRIATRQLASVHFSSRFSMPWYPASAKTRLSSPCSKASPCVNR